MKLLLSKEYLSTSSCVANELACSNHLGSCDTISYVMVFDISFTGMTITTGNASIVRKIIVSSRR